VRISTCKHMHAYIYITMTKCRNVLLCCNQMPCSLVAYRCCVYIPCATFQFRLVTLFKSFVRLNIQKKFYKQMKACSFSYRDEFGVIFVAALQNWENKYFLHVYLSVSVKLNLYYVAIFTTLNLHGFSSRKQQRIYCRDTGTAFGICCGGAMYSCLLPVLCL